MMKTKNVTTKNQKWSFEFNFFLSIRHKFVYISIEIMKSSQFFFIALNKNWLNWLKLECIVFHRNSVSFASDRIVQRIVKSNLFLLINTKIPFVCRDAIEN